MPNVIRCTVTSFDRTTYLFTLRQEDLNHPEREPRETLMHFASMPLSAPDPADLVGRTFDIHT